MSGYFQRLAQRTGLVAASSRGDGRGKMLTPGSEPGLEQEQIVEVPQPGSAPAASREDSRDAAKAFAGEGAMPLRASSELSAQTQAPLQGPQFISASAPVAAPAAGEAVMPPQERAARSPAILEREELARAPRVTIATPRGLGTDAALASAPRRQRAPDALEHDVELAARTAADASAQSTREFPLQPYAEDAASARAQADGDSIELEARRPAREESATAMPGRPFLAQSPLLHASTAIDVRIGTVAVEVHQAAPPAVPPPPPAVLAPAPRPAAPREHFSPSRHYIRMD